MSSRQGITFDASTGEAETTPEPSGNEKRYRAKLDSQISIRQEMARIYRQNRTGDVPIEDLTKLFYCLQIMAKVSESVDLEIRLEKMEDSIT